MSRRERSAIVRAALAEQQERHEAEVAALREASATVATEIMQSERERLEALRLRLTKASGLLWSLAFQIEREDLDDCRRMKWSAKLRRLAAALEVKEPDTRPQPHPEDGAR